MSSSSIYRVLDQFDLDNDDFDDVPPAPAALLAVLRTVPDPRQRQGLRHELDGILTLVGCAVVAGSRSFVAIAEWAAAATPHALDKLGIRGEVPRNPRSGAPCNASTPTGSTSSWVPGPRCTTTSTPSKCRSSPWTASPFRGARGPDGRGRHLLAALTHDTTIVLGQRDVDRKTNEIPCCQSFSIPLTSSGY